ncbi:MAG: PHP-associated domain-containing protein [Methanolinea sp.]|nr:PHP-associated domain-containing protein [Methanolinea sp.]
MDLSCDLHIHSCFSIATSRRMVPPLILEACRTKGLDVIGSGDALYPEWRRMWEETLSRAGDCGTCVVPSAEIEDRNRVHHLVLMEDFASFRDLALDLAPSAPGLVSTGRPRVVLTGGEIARLVHRRGGLVGPAHAFTPWTSLYAAHDSLEACYGSEHVDFLELGLSADSSYGAAIPHLSRIPFISSSDAHGPDPWRLGREFVVLCAPEGTPAAVLDAIRKGDVVRNAGFFPEEGKYNRTACTRCYHQFPADDAISFSWKCPCCGGRIKKGVRDRARELSSGPALPRPPYLHMIPLAEILARVLSVSSVRSRSVSTLYDRFIRAFGNEISVLMEVPPQNLSEIHPGAAAAVDALRSGRVRLVPGGGGRYGTFSFF